jgi:hypothetical protein
LADPEKKHPFDDLGFEVGSVLLGHEACGEGLAVDDILVGLSEYVARLRRVGKGAAA